MFWLRNVKKPGSTQKTENLTRMAQRPRAKHIKTIHSTFFVKTVHVSTLSSTAKSVISHARFPLCVHPPFDTPFNTCLRPLQASLDTACTHRVWPAVDLCGYRIVRVSSFSRRGFLLCHVQALVCHASPPSSQRTHILLSSSSHRPLSISSQADPHDKTKNAKQQNY